MVIYFIRINLFQFKVRFLYFTYLFHIFTMSLHQLTTNTPLLRVPILLELAVVNRVYGLGHAHSGNDGKLSVMVTMCGTEHALRCSLD